jgi:argininosuccinate lyase
MAYVEMIGRDRGRLKDCRTRLNEMPLGAAALAGTSFPIDRFVTAKALKFERPMANSMDAVSARDFALEFLAGASILGVHLSRFAEEITLWASPAFAFIKLSESFTTGSSIMPQKRNPDAAELVRGKSGRLLGNFTTLVAVMKGLSLTYAKDLQEDKEPVFDTYDTLELMIAATKGMVQDMTPNAVNMRKSLNEGFITATDLADWLVRSANIPFREAHHITGKIVRLAEANQCRLDELSLARMRSVDKRISAGVFEVLKPEHAVKSRNSFGGTAPKQVKTAIKAARRRFL